MRIAAAAGWNLSMNLSWKLEASMIKSSGRSPMATSDKALPMLPAAMAVRPDARSISAVTEVTVVLPLVPVTAA